MAKGNSNSNWPTAQQPDIKPEKMAAQIRALEDIRGLPQIDYTDPQAIEERVKYFFDFCINNELRPTVELMALSIGVSRVALWQWEQEGSTRGRVISSAKQVLAALMEQWGVTGRINPAAMCFLMKNHYGYRDVLGVEPVQSSNALDSLPTAAEVRRRIPKNTSCGEIEPDLSGLLDGMGEE